MPRGHRYIHLDDLKCVKKMQKKFNKKIEIYCISNSIFGLLFFIIFATQFGKLGKSTKLVYFYPYDILYNILSTLFETKRSNKEMKIL
jgi:hypothetical protein